MFSFNYRQLYLLDEFSFGTSTWKLLYLVNVLYVFVFYLHVSCTVSNGFPNKNGFIFLEAQNRLANGFYLDIMM